MSDDIDRILKDPNLRIGTIIKERLRKNKIKTLMEKIHKMCLEMEAEDYRKRRSANDENS